MPRPLQAVCVVPFGMEEGSELARGFITSLEMLDADQLAYKNLTAGRDRLVERLRVIVEGVPAS